MLSDLTTVCDFAGDTMQAHEKAITAGITSEGLRTVFLRGVSDQSFYRAAIYTVSAKPVPFIWTKAAVA